MMKSESHTGDAELIRFAESRRTLSADPYRPLYHFVSPESTLNDPNGLCFWQGGGTCSTRAIRRKIRASTGGTRSATI